MSNGKDQSVLVTGKGTFDCKDQLVKDFGAAWDPKEKGWWVPKTFLEKLKPIAAKHGLSIDGMPVRNDGSKQAASPGTAPKPPTEPTAPKPEAGTEQSAQLVSYAGLEAVGPGAKPKVIESSIYGPLKVQSGFVKLDATNTCVIQGKTSLLNQAYKEMSRLAGIRVILPQKIEVYDEQFGKTIEVPNPYITKFNGIIVAVECKAVAVGFTETGHLHICERTIYFHLMTQLMHTLTKIIADKPLCGEFMTRTAFLERPDDQRKWGFYIQIEGPDDFSTTGVAVNLEHDEIRSALANYQQLVKFAERGAQTKAEAMALKNFPGLGTPNPSQALADGGGVTYRRIIQVMGGSEKLEEIVERIRTNRPVMKTKDVTWDSERSDISDAEFEDVTSEAEEDEPEAAGNGEQVPVHAATEGVRDDEDLSH